MPSTAPYHCATRANEPTPTNPFAGPVNATRNMATTLPNDFIVLLLEQFVHDAAANPANVASWLTRRLPGVFSDPESVVAAIQDEISLNYPNCIDKINELLNEALATRN